MATDSVAAIGMAAREERRRRGLTQARLAQVAGVSRAFVIQLEGGRHARAELVKVAAVLSALDLDLAAVPRVPGSRELSAEERADALAEIFEDWDRGRSLPDEATQRIVRDYAAGRLSLDEAIAGIDALPAPMQV